MGDVRNEPGGEPGRAGLDLRICFLGDSLVQGVGDDSGGWVARLAAATRRRGVGVTAYALGIRGDTSRTIAARWYEEAERRLTGGTDRRIVLSFGINDADLVDGQRRVPEERSALYLSAMLRGAAEAGWPVLVVGPAPLGDEQYVARIASLSQALHKVCAQAGAEYVPLADLLAGSADWQASGGTGGDGFHPGADGYRLIAETVAEAGWWQWLGVA